MAHRHKVHAKHKSVGGGTVAYSGGDSNVAKEAKEHKHGGKVHGGHGHHRVHKRARGGGVGADKHPFSSAHMGK